MGMQRIKDFWLVEKIEVTLGEAILDIGRIAWQRTTLQIKARQGRTLEKFDKVWCKNQCFGTRTLMVMKWNHTRPVMGLFN
jgi:hypothetical protein